MSPTTLAPLLLQWPGPFQRFLRENDRGWPILYAAGAESGETVLLPARVSAGTALPGPAGDTHVVLWEEGGGGWYRGPRGGLRALGPGLSRLVRPVLWLQDAGLNLLAEAGHGNPVHWRLSPTGWNFVRSWSGDAWSAGRSGRHGLAMALAGGPEAGLWLWRADAWHPLPPPDGRWERPLLVPDTTGAVTVVCGQERLSILTWDGNWLARDELGDLRRGDFVNLLFEGGGISVLWGQSGGGYTLRSGRSGGPWSSPVQWRSDRSWLRPVRILYAANWQGPRAVYTDWPPGLPEPLPFPQAWRVAARSGNDRVTERGSTEPMGLLANMDQRLRRLEQWAANLQHRTEPTRAETWWRWFRRR